MKAGREITTRKRQRSKGLGSLFKRGGSGPWIASWYDHDGRRREKSTRTTDKAAADRILAKLVSETALRRDGVIDPAKDRYATEARHPLSTHIGAYVAHCKHVGHAPHHVNQKESHLHRLATDAGLGRLADLTADALERHLSSIRRTGRSARTVNFARQIAVAFMSWCVDTQRTESNPLTVVPKLDDSRDRRHERRPLTDDELARLLAVAAESGRKAWYLAAALAGLRRGDLERLQWRDIDFERQTITIREGKAKRLDMIPMHPDLAEELRLRRTASMGLATARVFPTVVTNLTRQKDFLRAGLAKREVVRDEDGQPVMVGQGKRRRPKTRIVSEDDEGRVIDLHALRTTFGTRLARAGVAPQIAQRLLRHADYRTTQRHYVVLGLADDAAAIAKMPPIKPTTDDARRATGTDDQPAQPPLRASSQPSAAPPLYPQQLGRETVRSGATACEERRLSAARVKPRNVLKKQVNCDGMQGGAPRCGKAGERIRTVNIQLGRLMLCQLSYARKFLRFNRSPVRPARVPLLGHESK